MTHEQIKEFRAIHPDAADAIERAQQNMDFGDWLKFEGRVEGATSAYREACDHFTTAINLMGGSEPATKNEGA